MVVASNCSGSFVKKTGIPQDRRPTPVGVVRTADGSITMSADGRGWSLPVSTLCTVLNSSTDNGVTVSLHLGFPLEAVGEASLLDLIKFSAVRSTHRRWGKKEQMTSYAWVDMTAQRAADRAGHSTHSRGTGDTKGGGGVAVVLVVGRSASARCTSAARARIAIAYGFCFCPSSQPACDFIPRRHQCLCFSRGKVPVPMVGLRASQFGTASEVPPGSKSTPPGTKPRCSPSARCPRDALRVLGDRILPRKRSILRPAILAPRPRCCRGGFLHTVVF